MKQDPSRVGMIRLPKYNVPDQIKNTIFTKYRSHFPHCKTCKAQFYNTILQALTILQIHHTKNLKMW